MAAKTVVLSVRMSPADRDELRRRAREAGLSQSEFIVRGLLGDAGGGLEARVAELERRAVGAAPADGDRVMGGEA